jgi:aminopeptidase N
MKNRLVLIGFLLFFFANLEAQELPFLISGDEKSENINEIERYEKLIQSKSVSSIASSWFDVTYYKLDLVVTANPQYISGVVTIKGICENQSSTILLFDLMNTMYVDSVHVNGTTSSHFQDPTSLNINLDTTFRDGAVLTIDIYYRGFPIGTGFGSFIIDEHSGIPWIWSLSEPFGARDWFPCKDHPSDKADSADIIVTCDSLFKVGSNGKLISVNNNGDGTKTHHWQERYPIASYLISIAITNYMQFSNWFHYSPSDSMEVLNYVIPERYVNAQSALPKTIDMLEIYSDLFGLYPFINEKYGHADFGRGGAMEHQTMTSTTTYEENTIAHELAHQWFGDMITCRTWSDLWLNEGFAQYAAALYLERKYGQSSYWNYMQNQLSNARRATGSLFVEDTTTIRNLFDVNRVYAKGAVVLHMLRHVLGDSIFFKAIFDYANDPQIKYSTASTADFQRVCELTSGIDLNYFFNQWIYGEGFSRYSVNWNLKDTSSGYVVLLRVNQVDGRNNPPFFTMPIDVKLSAAGWDTVVTVFNNALNQTFPIYVNHFVKIVQVDPQSWILKDVVEEFNQNFILDQNYPNPCRSFTTIYYQIPSQMHVNVSIFNILGQKIKTLVDEIKPVGNYETGWYDIADYPAGIYFYRLTVHNLTMVKKILVIR